MILLDGQKFEFQFSPGLLAQAPQTSLFSDRGLYGFLLWRQSSAQTNVKLVKQVPSDWIISWTVLELPSGYVKIAIENGHL
jgi:hypothetical protein